MPAEALVRAVRAFIQHSRGVHPSSISGGQSTSFRAAAESKGNLSVHIELSTIYQTDNGTVVKPVDAASKYPTDGFADQFGSTLKHTDIEATARGDINLPHVQGVTDERTRIRLQEDRARRQQEVQARNRERLDFQRQI
jgi:hypothetical protein